MTCARDPSVSTWERQDAFGRIVERFHNLAIALAYARLRDRSLAEDAAQDAFFVAWERLDQLRVPEAFPGWIRRLVLTQCERRRRSAHLTMSSQNEARTVDQAGSPVQVDRTDDRVLLNRAAARLRPADRLILSLYYGCERRHSEIAAWLRVPITTVARRLSHARRRLQGHALDALADGCGAESRRFADSFLLDLAAGIRRMHSGDHSGIGELVNGLDPDRLPSMPRSDPACAYLVVHPETHKPVAYAAAFPSIFRPIFDLQLAASDRAIRQHAADALLMQIAEDLTAKDAVSLQYRTTARHRTVVDFLRSRDFEVLDRAQDWRFDAAAAAHLVAGARTSLRFLDLSSLARPDLFEQALAILTDAMVTSPDAGITLPIHPDTLRRSLRAQHHGLVAFDGESLVGFIGASADQSPAAWRINLLVVARDARRRRVGTALLQQLLAGSSVTSVQALSRSDTEQQAWLAQFGFVCVGEILLLERLLRPTMTLAPERLDEYVGTYVVSTAARPMPPITIERHGPVLVSKVADMRDILLANSESEFFTRHHDGRGRFERDAAGRVVRLVFTDSGRDFVAIRSAD